VLDLSRHVNNFINDSLVQLDDLAAAEAVLEPGDFLTAYDLKNKFFHVKLHPDMKKFFRFAVSDESGGFKFYRFTILVYGCKRAVSVVMDLLKPVKALLPFTWMMAGWRRRRRLKPVRRCC
jgi:hypothetical protein